MEDIVLGEVEPAGLGVPEPAGVDGTPRASAAKEGSWYNDPPPNDAPAAEGEPPVGAEPPARKLEILERSGDAAPEDGAETDGDETLPTEEGDPEIPRADKLSGVLNEDVSDDGAAASEPPDKELSEDGEGVADP